MTTPSDRPRLIEVDFPSKQAWSKQSWPASNRPYLAERTPYVLGPPSYSICPSIPSMLHTKLHDQGSSPVEHYFSLAEFVDFCSGA